MIGILVALGLFCFGLFTAAVNYRRHGGHWPAWREWLTTEPLPDELRYDPYDEWFPK